jgi:Uma2 family endonuclease
VFELGEVIYAPFEVKLSPEGPSREPDILFVGRENLGRLRIERLEGPPDLVVEVVSQSSVREDKVRKFAEYEAAGVREYWLCDPRERQKTAEFFQLSENGIYVPAELDANGIYRSQVLPGLFLDEAWLWQDPLPNTQALLTGILREMPDLAPEIRRSFGLSG